MKNLVAVAYTVQIFFSLWGFVYLGVRIALASFLTVYTRYTHWGWTAVTFFFWLQLPLYAFPTIDRLLNVTFFPVAWGCSWTISILVIPLLYLHPESVTTPPARAGLQLVLDRVVHVLPTLLLVAYVALRRRALTRMFLRGTKWAVSLSIVGGVAPVLLYAAAVDIPGSYGVAVPELVVVGAMVLLALLANSILIAILCDDGRLELKISSKRM